MITIIFGPPGVGKTCLMTYLLNEQAFNRERTRKMQKEIMFKKNSGFDAIETIPIHSCSSNYSIKFKKFGYSPRPTRIINPYRLGFDNPFVKVHFSLPFECIGITEAQKYLNSRMSKCFPYWQSRWYEAHRHHDLDVFLDAQRPMLIDVNIRDLATFIEVMGLEILYGDYGKIRGLKWKVRRIATARLFDRYMSSSNEDKSCYTEDTIISNYNVFDLYDSQSCKPKFYAGHFDEDFDYNASEDVEQSVEGYIKYLEKFDDELPKNFYQTKIEVGEKAS